MSKRVCVIDLPGLSRDLLARVPGETALGKWLSGKRVASLTPSWPAVTCSVQATLTTGVSPSNHGIVANGIATYRSREDQRLIDASSFSDHRHDVSFWEQSNQLVEAPRFWTGKFKTALLFFQNSMPGFIEPLKPAADIVITPKPEHGPDGKITSLLWAEPRDLVARLFKQLGPFPLMNYWGPLANIHSSRWIASAAASVWRELGPQLQLVYVPHLDYDLQRFGPDSAQAAQAVRDVATVLDRIIDAVLNEANATLVVLSEYSMRAVKRSIQPNHLLATAGLLKTRDTTDGKLIDYARSEAFALCDHQIAHVYLRDKSSEQAVRDALSHVILSIDEPATRNLRHRRAGDLLLEAASDAWFDYRWWDKQDAAPSFARLVDIHRKPGYDPLELFLDAASGGIAQDGNMIRGSHGSVTPGEAVYITDESAKFDAEQLTMTDVATVLSDLLLSS